MLELLGLGTIDAPRVAVVDALNHKFLERTTDDH